MICLHCFCPNWKTIYKNISRILNLELLNKSVESRLRIMNPRLNTNVQSSCQIRSISSVQVISALFGHSVYLRFTDTTTNNALTTIGGFDMGRKKYGSIHFVCRNLPQLLHPCWSPFQDEGAWIHLSLILWFWWWIFTLWVPAEFAKKEASDFEFLVHVVRWKLMPCRCDIITSYCIVANKTPCDSQWEYECMYQFKKVQYSHKRNQQLWEGAPPWIYLYNIGNYRLDTDLETYIYIHLLYVYTNICRLQTPHTHTHKHWTN